MNLAQSKILPATSAVPRCIITMDVPQAPGKLTYRNKLRNTTAQRDEKILTAISSFRSAVRYGDLAKVLKMPRGLTMERLRAMVVDGRLVRALINGKDYMYWIPAK